MGGVTGGEVQLPQDFTITGVQTIYLHYRNKPGGDLTCDAIHYIARTMNNVKA